VDGGETTCTVVGVVAGGGVPPDRIGRGFAGALGAAEGAGPDATAPPPDGAALRPFEADCALPRGWFAVDGVAVGAAIGRPNWSTYSTWCTSRTTIRVRAGGAVAAGAIAALTGAL
jgi:hypothetical protein